MKKKTKEQTLKEPRISNSTTCPREQWTLPKPTLRPGAEDFLKVPSLRNGKRYAHTPMRGMGLK